LARVRIVIPTLTGGPVLEECLEALASQRFRDFDVVVIQNGPCPELTRSGPDAGPRWIRVPVNLGFGEAVNRGASDSDSEFVVALNDDTAADPEWLGELVAAMDRHPRAGMAAPLIIRSADGRLDSAGMAVTRDGTGKQRGSGQAPSSFEAEDSVLFPSGCAAIYRRIALITVGGFDSDFFLYGEDTDLGLRMQRAGWSCRFVPSARIQHRYSFTGGAGSASKVYFAERNRLAVLVKNFPWQTALAAPFWTLYRYTCHVQYLREGRGYAGQVPGAVPFGAYLRAIVRAHWDFLGWLPKLLAARKVIARNARLSHSEYRSLLRRYRIPLREAARG
jgi:GT2 family glycosyltransferase